MLFIVLYAFLGAYVKANCLSCIKDDTLLVYVYFDNGKIIPLDYLSCNSVESCYNGICDGMGISNVSAVLVGNGNENHRKKLENRKYGCMYAQTFLSGVDSKFNYVQGVYDVCSSALVCFSKICDIISYKNVTYVMVEPTG